MIWMLSYHVLLLYDNGGKTILKELDAWEEGVEHLCRVLAVHGGGRCQAAPSRCCFVSTVVLS